MPAPIPAVWHPQNAEEACRLKRRFGEDAVYVSGGTLLRTQWEAGDRQVPAGLIDLTAVKELRGLEEEGGALAIGALTTLTACRREPGVQNRFPLLAEAARAIAAPPVRNLATIGGNVLSEVGDSLPALLAYEARLEWQQGEEVRTQAAAEWLERTRGGPEDANRLLLRIRLPLEAAEPDGGDGGNGRTFGFYEKIGRRETFVPSSVTMAIRGRIDGGGRLRDIRLAAGGGRTIPKRFPLLEERLEGAAADDNAVLTLHRLLLEQYAPAPDPFESADYRKRVAANVAASHLWKAIRNQEGERRAGDAAQSREQRRPMADEAGRTG
ncbi:FAD binding domain-containing protein [Cohnella zeiphila]|uniref:FAD binding domain-containing protein n=1 Tax=Cohnella zeiphila TaxID=2761120 RepID=A0A7X0SLD3_9BACL|nr:FAD binding domain-containing protein [Cohnella zeiphila]MBB6732026.1 FAD binding domain-containing protein [Cohnella zeiphila]